MKTFTQSQRMRLHVLILGSSMALFLIYAAVLPEFRFFWDPSVKWFQILDLIRFGFADIGCVYPARAFDPDFRHMPMAYVSLVEGRCLYWFPYQLAFVFGPVHAVLGVWSVPLLQHAFSIFIMYAMTAICARLGLSFGGTCLALLLFRLATANLNSVANLEDHGIAAALYMGAILLLIRNGSDREGTGPAGIYAAGGLLAAGAFAFRPEAALNGPFLAAAIFFTAGNRRTGLIRAMVFTTGFALVLGVVLWMNHAVTGYALGMRSIDPVNRVAYTAVGARLSRAGAHLFLAPEWWVNGLLFQMPLLGAVFLNLREKSRGEAGSRAMRFALIACAVLFPLAYTAPFGGPHIGFRFATFLYPILIPLALRPFRNAGRPARVLLAAAVIYSISLTVPLAAYGVAVYRGYLKTHRELKALPGHAVLLRDDIMWHVLSDHYYERPIMTALKDGEVETLVARLRSGKRNRILLARSAARPAAKPLVPAALRGRIKRKGKSSVLEWALLDFSPRKPVP